MSHLPHNSWPSFFTLICGVGNFLCIFLCVWNLSYNTWHIYIYIRWNNRKLRRVFPVSVVKAITLSTSLRLLHADHTVRLSTAAFCNLENWVHRYTTEAHATNKICTLFLSRFFLHKRLTKRCLPTLRTDFKSLSSHIFASTSLEKKGTLHTMT